MLEDTFLYERRFNILFDDAINFAKKANKAYEKEDYYELELYSRASIFTATLIFECAANCCLDTLKLSNHFAEDIDKLPFLSKYEFFYNTLNKEKNLDRGCQEFQNAAELKSIRDLIVHPKVKKTKWKRINQSNLQADFGQTKLLKVPHSIDEWNLTDIQTCLRVICAFLDYFFRISCGFTPNEVGDIILSSEDYNKQKRVTTYGINDAWKEAQKYWSLRLQFLGIECPKMLNI
ncbi:MAG: hypothetical protein IH618_07990 [Ignavibacteriaceae bacterium]|nr:hypothetical protein [Ignavibacteriaceae bacterium]